MKRKLILVMVGFFGVLGALFCSSNAFADVDQSKIMEKWLLTQYIACINGNRNELSIDGSSLSANKLVSTSVFANGNAKKKKMKLPSYNFNGVSSGKKISCNEMFLGSSEIGNKGLLSYSKMNGSAVWGDGAKEFLTGLGYTQSTSGDRKINIHFVKTSQNMNDTLKDLWINISYKNNRYSVDGGGIFPTSITNNKIIIRPSLGIGFCSLIKRDGVESAYGGNPIEIPIGGSFEATVNNIKGKLTRNLEWYYLCGAMGGGGFGDTTIGFPDSGEYVVANENSSYSYPTSSNKREAALNTAIKSLTGKSGSSAVLWTKPERYTIYVYYLQKASGGKISCDVESTDGLTQVKLKDNSGKLNEKCYVDLKGNNPKVNIQKGDYTLVTARITTLINWLNNTDYTNKELAELPVLSATGGSSDGDGEGGGEAEPNCANSGAAGSLGWIVCPALELMADAAETLYTSYVEPALQVSPKLFSKDQDHGTRYAWGIFQGVANTIFIVMLLVIIFSQLTGMGIDNYGIKKVLPKLIIAAVLINLSYLICILAVDLSNMIGNGIQQLFNSYKGAEHISIAVNGATVDVGNIGVTALTGAVILAALVAGIWGVIQQGGGPAIILALVVAALTIVVSIFGLFLLLAAREAAIIVLTVASPIAFACYMLPNTKSVFDKWFKFMKALLLVYPICGLLVGGGNFVSKLLLSSGAGEAGFFSAFMAMVIGVAPIFFIPSAIKGSLSALGKIGEGLNKFTAGAKSRAMRGVGALDRGVRNSERFKNHAAEFQRNKTRRVNERTNRRLSAKRDRRGGLSRYDTRTLARSTEALDKLGQEDLAAETVLAKRDTRGMTEDELHDQWDDAFRNNSGELDALTNVMISKYGNGAANWISGRLGRDDIDLANNANQRAAMERLRDNMQNNSAFAQAMRDKAPDAYNMINSGGVIGHDKNTGEAQYGDMDHFSRNNGITTNLSDWSKVGTNTLRRALVNGTFTAQQAEEMLNSTDPAIQSGIQSDSTKRELLEAAVQASSNAPQTRDPHEGFVLGTTSVTDANGNTREVQTFNGESVEKLAGGYESTQRTQARAAEQRTQQMADDLHAIATGQQGQ